MLLIYSKYANLVSELYLLYAKLEEEHGLARHAMAVYERATTAVLPEEQYEVVSIFVSLNKSLRNKSHTRYIRALNYAKITGYYEQTC